MDYQWQTEREMVKMISASYDNTILPLVKIKSCLKKAAFLHFQKKSSLFPNPRKALD